MVANAVAECIWLRQVLGELHCPINSAAMAFCNNVSTVYMISNLVQHQRMKHIEIGIHFLWERAALGELHFRHVPSEQQFTDVMTKGLPYPTFKSFRSSLCVGDPPA
jgi:hypothetical protein